MVTTGMYPRIVAKSPKSFFLFGIRGSGKSTWVKDQYPYALRVDLLDERLFSDLLLRPETFSGMVADLPPKSWVLIDEVQRIPGLLNYVHKFIEEKRLNFVLTGSSSRKLHRAGVNLLAGRALLKQMHPFVPEELGVDFSLKKALRFGTLPIIWTDVDPEMSLEAYVQLFLKDEIRAEGLVRSFPAFARFFQVASLMHAQTINIASLSRDSGVARSTLLDHLSILEDTYVIFHLPAFESRLRVRERKQPKLYWVDPGLARAAAGRRGEVTPEEQGPLLEGWIASLLRTYGDQRQLFDSMSYWSLHQSRVEVDFVLKRGKELLAIEVKSSKQVKQEHLSGLRAIGEHQRISRRILVYDGIHRLQLEGIEVWPIGEMLKALAEDSLWP